MCLVPAILPYCHTAPGAKVWRRVKGGCATAPQLDRCLNNVSDIRYHEYGVRGMDRTMAVTAETSGETRAEISSRTGVSNTKHGLQPELNTEVYI